MTVRQEGPVIYLEGDCPIEQAEALAAILDSEDDFTVDMSQCRHLHTSLVQVLLRFRPKVDGGAPEDPFLRDMITPALKTGRA